MKARCWAKPAGRPKKPRLYAKLLDGESIRISDILSEALDGKTKAIYVLCEQAKDIKTAQWIPVSSLSPAAREWWENEREMRFPNIDLPTELPSPSHRRPCDASDGWQFLAPSSQRKKSDFQDKIRLYLFLA